MTNTPKIIEQAKNRLIEMITNKSIFDARVSVLARALTPEEAIGTPGRRDFPIIIGKEKMLEAKVLGFRGQAFTDSRKEFIGTLKEVLEMPLNTNSNRAIFVAVFNALMRYFGKANGTVHCKNEEPERCAVEIADFIHNNFHPKKVGLIGLNPAIAEALSKKFGGDNLLITDLYIKNIGRKKFGTKIFDGNIMNEKLIQASDFVLITGTTIVNDTFDEIMSAVKKYNKEYTLYGVTSAGICSLFDMPRICPYSK